MYKIYEYVTESPSQLCHVAFVLLFINRAGSTICPTRHPIRMAYPNRERNHKRSILTKVLRSHSAQHARSQWVRKTSMSMNKEMIEKMRDQAKSPQAPSTVSSKAWYEELSQGGSYADDDSIGKAQMKKVGPEGQTATSREVTGAAVAGAITGFVLGGPLGAVAVGAASTAFVRSPSVAGGIVRKGGEAFARVGDQIGDRIMENEAARGTVEQAQGVWDKNVAPRVNAGLFNCGNIDDVVEDNKILDGVSDSSPVPDLRRMEV